MQLGQRLHPAVGQRVQDLLALFARGAGRVADHAAGAEVARGPGAGRAAVGRQQLDREGRWKVGHRAFHVHGVGRQREHQRGFGMARVHRELLLLLAHLLARRAGQARHAVRHDHEVAMAQAQFARRHLQHLRLAAVPVGEQQLAKARAIHRLADFDHGRQQRGARERHRAGKVQVLFRLAVGDRRQGKGAHLGRQLLQRLAHHARGDHAVDRARQVRAVLLDGAAGQHDDGVLAVGQRGDFGPAQVGQEAVGRDVAVEHGIPCVFFIQGRKAMHRRASRGRRAAPRGWRCARASRGGRPA
ncbi:hypothetical protein FQZ97_640060 [compost metagenome]